MKGWRNIHTIFEAGERRWTRINKKKEIKKDLMRYLTALQKK